MACICGGVGEVLIIGGIISGVAWLWRKLFKNWKPKGCTDKCNPQGTGHYKHKH